ncbi:MAG TPA: NAD(P)-dependent oxidoreductase [Methylocella sp.]|jgi:nucleoside-diphosphate-sugar epimerase|nr:NAD(P)-dependent oxidoreductase [Methylocella sp.]
MKIFVAGATGVVGRRLVLLLTAAGHEVAGLTRSPAKAGLLRRIGVTPIIADALDRAAVMEVVHRQKPEIVVHELTSIKKIDLRNFDRGFAATNRLRTAGTDNLLAAARAAGARRFITQSFAGWPYARAGGPIKTEEDPLDPEPPAAFRRTLEAIRYLESAIIGESSLEGLVLRYGSFYGPGTAISKDGWMVNDVRERRIPIVGGGGGVWSFTHVDDAARFTRAAVERGAPGVYNIVDDDPARVSQWLPALAEALGAKPPRRIPAWIARFVIGDAVVFMTDVRGASNAKAKRAFGLNLIWPSWRDGFKRGLGDPSRA